MKDIVYVPILSSKRGELTALKHIAPEIRSRFCPLIEVIPDSDIDSKTTEEDMTERAARASGKLSSASGMDNGFSAFFDLSEVFAENGSAYCESLLQKLPRQAIPVITSESDEDYDSLCFQYVKGAEPSICVRLSSEVLAPDEPWEGFASAILAKSQASAGYLVLDFATDIPAIEQLAKLIGEMNDPSIWRAIIVATAGFPESMSGLNYGKNKVPRKGYKLWRELKGRPELDSVEHFIFGDYTVTNPLAGVDFVPGFMQVAAKIKYTASDHWLVWKGRSTKLHGFAQFYTLAKHVTEDEAFSGREYSWGDEKIYQCAKGEGGTGNHGTWVSIATNHHITFAVEQLASSLAPAI